MHPCSLLSLVCKFLIFLQLTMCVAVQTRWMLLRA